MILDTKSTFRFSLFLGFVFVVITEVFFLEDVPTWITMAYGASAGVCFLLAGLCHFAHLFTGSARFDENEEAEDWPHHDVCSANDSDKK